MAGILRVIRDAYTNNDVEWINQLKDVVGVNTCLISIVIENEPNEDDACTLIAWLLANDVGCWSLFCKHVQLARVMRRDQIHHILTPRRDGAIFSDRLKIALDWLFTFPEK